MSDRGKQRSGWSLALLVIVVASLVPVLWIVMLSLKTPATVTDGSFIPHAWTLSNYSAIFKLGTFTPALRNSIGIGLIDIDGPRWLIEELEKQSPRIVARLLVVRDSSPPDEEWARLTIEFVERER